MILKGANESEGSADVVVGHDQRRVETLTDVAANLAQLREDAIKRPTLERAAEVDADDLPEDARVDPLNVVARQTAVSSRLGLVHVINDHPNSLMTLTALAHAFLSCRTVSFVLALAG